MTTAKKAADTITLAESTLVGSAAEHGYVRPITAKSIRTAKALAARGLLEARATATSNDPRNAIVGFSPKMVFHITAAGKRAIQEFRRRRK